MSSRKVTDIGILGGTFDPIHLGHTLPAKEVANYLALDKVLFIPANIPPHKATPNVCAKQRADMVKLACSSESIFHCNELELARKGNSYTVDTLKMLAQDYPQSRLFFIIGLDSLLTFTTWHNYQEILSLCHLVVNTRPNYQLNDVNQATKDLLKHHQVKDISRLKNSVCGAILFLSDVFDHTNKQLKQLNIDISSSEIRQQLATGQDDQPLLAPEVLDFINKNKLYR